MEGELQAGEPGREANGRFTSGNQFSVGLQNRSGKLARYRAVFDEAITDDDIRAVAFALLRAALNGDVAASKVILERKLGKVETDPQENTTARLVLVMPDDGRDTSEYGNGSPPA